MFDKPKKQFVYEYIHRDRDLFILFDMRSIIVQHYVGSSTN